MKQTRLVLPAATRSMIAVMAVLAIVLAAAVAAPARAASEPTGSVTTRSVTPPSTPTGNQVDARQPRATTTVKPRWKRDTVHWCDRTGWAKTVNRAVRFFRQTPTVGPSLKKVKHCADAQIRIVKQTAGDGADGYTETWTDGSRITKARIVLDPVLGTESNGYRLHVAAHEFGHALGLGHKSSLCSLMNPSGYLATDCDPPAGYEDWDRCGPQRIDAKALKRLYGGLVGSYDGFICRGSETLGPY